MIAPDSEILSVPSRDDLRFFPPIEDAVPFLAILETAA